jgi:hypothetical protein
MVTWLLLLLLLLWGVVIEANATHTHTHTDKKNPNDIRKQKNRTFFYIVRYDTHRNRPKEKEKWGFVGFLLSLPRRLAQVVPTELAQL